MKGDHEKTVDMVRQLIRQGKGMTEIMNFTNLSAEEFTQIRNKKRISTHPKIHLSPSKKIPTNLF
jgi:hypothetical protein